MFLIIVFVIPTAYSLVLPNTRMLHVGETDVIICAVECTKCTTDLVAVDRHMEETFTNDVFFHRLEESVAIAVISRFGNVSLLSLSLTKSSVNPLLRRVKCMTIDNDAVIDSTEISINYDCKCVENGEGY